MSSSSNPNVREAALAVREIRSNRDRINSMSINEIQNLTDRLSNALDRLPVNNNGELPPGVYNSMSDLRNNLNRLLIRRNQTAGKRKHKKNKNTKRRRTRKHFLLCRN